MRLTIRISTNALSFSAQQADGTIAYEPYHVKSGVSIAANLRQAFSESELLASGYKSVLVLMDAPVLLIPIEEYRQETVEVLYTTPIKPTIAAPCCTACCPMLTRWPPSA